MATDFTKAPNQIIIDLVNEMNPSLGLTLDLVTFGLPTVHSGAENRDTQLTLTSVPGSGYSGTQDIFYNRVDIATVPGTRSLIYTLGDAVNISDLIPEINARYGINITADDYTDGPLPAFAGGEANEEHDFDIVIVANALVFEGTLTLTLKANDIPLADAIAVNVLTGLVFVQPA